MALDFARAAVQISGFRRCHHMGGNQAMAFTRPEDGGQVYSFSANNCLAYSVAKQGVQVNQCKGTGTHWSFNRDDGTMR